MDLAAWMMVLIFASFTVVQFDDPDRLLWIPLYLLPTVLSAPPAFHRAGFMPVVGASCFYFLFSGYWAIWGKDGPSCGDLLGIKKWPKAIEREKVRETYGLLIVALWLAGLAWHLSGKV